jgi:hypothetical protein
MATYKARNCSGYPLSARQGFKSLPPAEPTEDDEFGELDLIEGVVVCGAWVLGTAAVALFLLLASRHLPVF